MAARMGSKVAAILAILSVLVVHGSCKGHPVNYNVSDASAYGSGWLPARATWYGAPTGAGPDDNGGACGFKNVNQYPFSSMTSCGNEPIFKDGKGCGSCYQIRCNKDPSCSGNIETVIITDMNYYPVARYHFDLSGTAFGAMAKPGLNDKLRHSGIIDIQFRRVPCNYPGLKINFHVEEGSNPVYFAVLVEYEDLDGDVVQVDLMESKSAYGGATGVWTAMRESWGSIWRLDSNHRLQAPFSLRIRSDSGKTLVANNVIPANWSPNSNYRSIVQFS
uniref:Expansin-like EG45 domain-containing protein n=1 Tax=Oryza nivara TaxID=4536 RepID=A0A0E0IWC3_ORYNI